MGDACFKLTRIIVKKPERGAGFISFSPHIMVNSADAVATNITNTSIFTSTRHT